MGFTVADYVQDVEVWPENHAAWRLFRWLDTQWRVGMNGPTGFDYTPLLLRLDRMGLDHDDYEQMLDDVRTLESAALNAINTK